MSALDHLYPMRQKPGTLWLTRKANVITVYAADGTTWPYGPSNEEAELSARIEAAKRTAQPPTA